MKTLGFLDFALEVAQVLAQLKKFEELDFVRYGERNERLFDRKERGGDRERPLTATWDINYIFW